MTRTRLSPTNVHMIVYVKENLNKVHLRQFKTSNKEEKTDKNISSNAVLHGENWSKWILNLLIIINSGDLNSKHLNNGIIRVADFCLSSIQISGIQMVVQYSYHHLNSSPGFKWWSEYHTNFCPVFKGHLNTGPFGHRTTFDHLNTRLVWYSDPHCIISQVWNFRKRITSYKKIGHN